MFAFSRILFPFTVCDFIFISVFAFLENILRQFEDIWLFLATCMCSLILLREKVVVGIQSTAAPITERIIRLWKAVAQLVADIIYHNININFAHQ